MRVLLPRLDGGVEPEFAAFFDGVIGKRPSGGIPNGDQFDDWLPDPIYFEDVRLERKAFLARLGDLWAKGEIETSPPKRFDVTRSEGRSLNAMALPLELRLFAHAVIADLAPRISRAILRDKVHGFGFRVNKVPRFERPGENAELVGDAAIELLNLGFGDPVTVLDISGFAERARLDQLAQRLQRAGVLGEQVKFLHNLLATDMAGLPSIDDAFAFLYNFYLVPVDNELVRSEANFFRYRDEYFLISEKGLPIVEQALAALGLTARRRIRHLSSESARDELQDRASQMTRNRMEGGVLEEVIGPLGDGYLYASFLTLCESDCFEVYFKRDPSLTKRIFFEACRSGSPVDGVKALPCLRSFNRRRRSSAWRMPPLDGATANVRTLVTEFAENRQALTAALETAIGSDADWQISWVTPLLSDIGPLDDATVTLLRRQLAQSSDTVGAEAVRLALSRSSSAPASDIWKPVRTADDVFTRRSRGLTAHFLRQRGETEPWSNTRPLLATTEPHLVRFLDRL